MRVYALWHAQYLTSLVYARWSTHTAGLEQYWSSRLPWEYWGTMMGGRTAVLLLHAAAAFQFHENKCEPKTSLPTSEDSKRIAFILRGDAYRGLSYGSTARGSKRGFMCTPFAVRIQRAISARMSITSSRRWRPRVLVDVFFATYPCATDGEAQLERLKGFYNRNATRVVHVDRVPRPGATQATPANIAMKSLRRLWPKVRATAPSSSGVLILWQPVWKSTSASGARRFTSFFGDDVAVRSSGEAGIATPSSRRRVDGVEDDAMIQHERAVKF